jgi:hypothetical protein
MRSDWSFGTMASRGGGTLGVGKDGNIGYGEEGEEDDDGSDVDADEHKFASGRWSGTAEGSADSQQGSTVRGIVSYL